MSKLTILGQAKRETRSVANRFNIDALSDTQNPIGSCVSKDGTKTILQYDFGKNTFAEVCKAL